MTEYGELAAQAEEFRPHQLEQRYRRVLRLLPASYRAVWEEDMVATFLAGVATDDPEEAEYAADFGRPSWGEAASVVALAVRLRIATPAAPPRYLSWGQALRLVGLAGVLVHAVWAIIGVGIQLWVASKLPWPPPPAPEWQRPLPSDYRRLVWDFADLVWVAAFAALLLGRWRAARILATLGVLRLAFLVGVPAVVDVVNTGRLHIPFLAWFELLLAGLLLVALAAFHRDAPRMRPRPWLVALPVGVAAGSALVSTFSGDAMPVLDVLSLQGLAVLGAAGWLLVGPARRTGSAAWRQAVVILALAAAGERMVSLLDYRGATTPAGAEVPGLDRFIAVAVAESAALLVAGVALAVRARRLQRALPPVAEDAAAWTGRSR